ncbi:protein of unknown function (plasmid) [Cupriavidus taiwanensis]|nr:protein of unknown function [Cupriavidus taiwanensis]
MIYGASAEASQSSFQLPVKHQYVQVVEHEPAPPSVGETAITRSTLPAMVAFC